MKVMPPSAARSSTDLAAASSICRPKVMVPKQSRETFRPVRPSRICSMATPSGLVHLVVVGLHLKRSEPVVDVGVTDEEIEPYSRTARGEGVVCGRDDLDAADETFEDVAANGRLDHIAILDAILRTDQLFQRGEVPHLSIPAHDFRVSLVGLKAPPEHLIPRAQMRCDRAAQAYLDLLEVLGRRFFAENSALPVLVLSPSTRQHRGRIVVVPFRD